MLIPFHYLRSRYLYQLAMELSSRRILSLILALLVSYCDFKKTQEIYCTRMATFYSCLSTGLIRLWYIYFSKELHASDT